MEHIKLFEEFTNLKIDSLYHSTDIDAFFSIILLNELAGVTPQEINGVLVRGVSCTYDKNFIYKNKDITLELSYTLTEKWKTYNVNFFTTEFGKQKAKEHNLENVDEKEVFIVTGDIFSKKSVKPLSKYLVSIRINKDIVLPEDIKEILESSYNHIKIYDYKNKNITKKIIKNKGIGFDMDNFISGFDEY